MAAQESQGDLELRRIRRRESRLRRQARRLTPPLAIRKHRGGYALVDLDSETVQHGVRFQLSLDDVEQIIQDEDFDNLLYHGTGDEIQYDAREGSLDLDEQVRLERLKSEEVVIEDQPEAT